MERPICAIVLVGNKTFLFLSPVKWMSNCFSCTCFGYSKSLYSLRLLGNWLDFTLQLSVIEIAQICMLNEKWNVKNNGVLAGVSFPLPLRCALLALDDCVFILLPNVRLSRPIVRFRMHLLFFLSRYNINWINLDHWLTTEPFTIYFRSCLFFPYGFRFLCLIILHEKCQLPLLLFSKVDNVKLS